MRKKARKVVRRRVKTVSPGAARVAADRLAAMYANGVARDINALFQDWRKMNDDLAERIRNLGERMTNIERIANDVADTVLGPR